MVKVESKTYFIHVYTYM